jgi:predicted transposase/invertase (TIGR01784 family)
VLVLDPKLDVVFKMLLTHEPALLVDMLQGVLARNVRAPTVLNPGILGAHVRNKQVSLDLRVALEDGSRADVEMQCRTPANLAARLVYYGARDFADQLVRGDDYDRLTRTSVIAWLAQPMYRGLRRLHAIFELRERHTHTLFSDHLAFHILQLSHLHHSPLSGAPASRYDAQVTRWARFFTARSHAELEQLASETRIMSLAKETLDRLSQDPPARRLAREREDALKLYRDELAVTLAKGEAKGRRAGRREGRQEARVEILLEQLGMRFGRLSAATRARVQSATSEQLAAWAKRVVTAPTLDEVFAR